jgi:hypothetical protein
MKTPIIAMVFAGALAMPMAAGTALADHDHTLVTPGKNVVDIADGQTEKCSTDPGGHKFHVNVHLGRPGDFAFAQPNNSVSIGKTENPTC